MAEAVTILGVASAVLQFVDFSSKLINWNREVYARNPSLRPYHWLAPPGPSTRDIVNGISAGIKELDAVAGYLLPISNANGELSNDEFTKMVAESVDRLKFILPMLIGFRDDMTWRMVSVIDRQRDDVLELIQDMLSRMSAKVLDAM